MRTTIGIAILTGLTALAAAGEGTLVPAGPFRMGSNRVPDETPTHTVDVPAFRMDVTEVRNADYAKFIAAKGYAEKKWWSEAGWTWREKEGVTAPAGWEERKKELAEAFDDHPVVGVSYHEAEAYARFAGKRLPTEAEWEKAARGATGRTWPWGEEETGGGPVGAAKTNTRPVGTNPKDKSAYGILDLGGNVAEWTSSWYGPYPGTEHESRHHGETYRVIRGGSWRFETPAKRRGAWRGYWRYGEPTARLPFVGIRLVEDVRPAGDGD
jgi:iron(II)-dependent oxidoreductase